MNMRINGPRYHKENGCKGITTLLPLHLLSKPNSNPDPLTKPLSLGMREPVAMGVVQALASSAELVALLPLAHLSVVLFTAAWSRDSAAARSALDRVAASFPPRGEPPHVAFYAVQLPITEVHAAPPVVPRRAFWLPAAAAQLAADRAAYNATRQLPWFPALRVFAAANTGAPGDGLPPFTYGDSYTAPAMRRFVLDVAHRVIADMERREDARLTGGGGPPPACPSSLRGDAGRLGDAWSKGLAAGAATLLPVGGAAGRARTALTALLPRVGDPVEMSPDGLTSLLFPAEPASADDVPCGALIFAPGGAETVAARHRGLWRVVSAAIEAVNSRARRQWVVSVIDSTQFREFGDRLGVAPTLADPKLVLVDSARDSVLLPPLLPNTTDAATVLLESLSTAGQSARPFPPPLRAAGAGSIASARSPAVLRSERVQHVRSADLDRVAAEHAARGHMVWVVVHQPWCGFSQRAMAVFRALADVAPSGVYVLEISDVDALPAGVDALVNGFPTVLMIPGDGRIGLNSACMGGTCKYVEHTAELSVSALLKNTELFQQLVTVPNAS
jgi:hypothetical protein